VRCPFSHTLLLLFPPLAGVFLTRTIKPFTPHVFPHRSWLSSDFLCPLTLLLLRPLNSPTEGHRPGELGAEEWFCFAPVVDVEVSPSGLTVCLICAVVFSPLFKPSNRPLLEFVVDGVFALMRPVRLACPFFSRYALCTGLPGLIATNLVGSP